MRSFTVKSNKTVTDENIADIVITAFEGGGISYWCEDVTPVERDENGDWYEMIGEQYTQWQRDGVGAYATPEFWDNDKRGYRLTTDEGDQKKVLTLSSLLKALQYQPPHQKGVSDNWFRKVTDRLFEEQYDAEDADAIVQIAVLGELVYG